jgi:hypothetical protein
VLALRYLELAPDLFIINGACAGETVKRAVLATVQLGSNPAGRVVGNEAILCPGFPNAGAYDELIPG